MTKEVAYREHLTAFLAAKDRTLDDLKSLVDNVFGTPRLVVAVGSVVEGFGNDESDVDLAVLVDSPSVTDFPVSSHAIDVPVDLNYLNTTWVREESQHIIRGWRPEPIGGGYAAWKAGNRRMWRLGRLATGLTLLADPSWESWMADLRDSFRRYATQWWRQEGVRRMAAARILAVGNPLLAAQRYCDAGLALLESRAAEADEYYIGPKWIAAKLARMGDDSLRATYSELLALPIHSGEALGYNAHAEDLLSTMAGDMQLPLDPYLVLTPLAGFTRHTHRDRVLVHRFAAPGLESGDPSFGAVDGDGVLWHGRAGDLPEDAKALARHGLAWLSVGEESAR